MISPKSHYICAYYSTNPENNSKYLLNSKNLYIMKKITGLFLIAGMCIFSACGPDAEEKAVDVDREVEIESIQSTEETELERMAAEAQAEIEAQAAEDTKAAEEGGK